MFSFLFDDIYGMVYYHEIPRCAAIDKYIEQPTATATNYTNLHE